ncbi:PREDICTED: decorin-like [Dinoponera quadriceps]|uniref:Decorin-like n=1 Tax=Dinoponera quadriceps TaxID=609295 RepID=A0A6P3WYU5_DINQU|nr:PREDICTED: decorin-like [Dinoponera quadriceps]
MEIGRTFTVFIILITVCLVKTRERNYIIPNPTAKTHFKEQSLNTVSFKSAKIIETSTISSPGPISTPRPQLYDIILRFSEVGLRKIGPDFIISQKIISLSLDNNEISNISPLAFRSMRNLRYLNLSGNKIPTERLLSLEGVTELQTLIINNNNPINPIKIEKHSNYSAVECVFEKLEYLHLCNSQLKNFKIHHQMMPLLTHLYLSNNSIESADIIFNNIPATLRTLYLDNNLIDQVEQNKLRNLLELVMNNNYITEVCFDKCQKKSIPLRGANKLKKLSLSKNQISKVLVDAFTDTEKLEYLDLSGNNITEIINGTFNNPVWIKILSLADNKFITIPNICPLKYLTSLDLSGNRINAVHANNFCNFAYLERLYLANNSITTIGHQAFSNFRSLKNLDLSGNQLSQFPPQWANVWRLEELHLERNKFEELSDVTLGTMKKLKNVYLDENPMIHFKAESFKSLSANFTVHLKNILIEKTYEDNYDDSNDYD